MSVSRVLDLLLEITTVLRTYSVTDWEDIIWTRHEDLREAAQSDNSRLISAELNAILGLYGGMGSFNDLFLTDKAGDDIEASEVSPVNAQLQKLKSELFRSVNEVISHLEKGEGDRSQ